MLRDRRSGTGRTVRRAVVAVLLMVGMPGLALAAQVELVSRAPWRRAPDTAGAGHPLGRSPLSADGRYFVYSSDASNLVPGQIDSNAGTDVFLYDRLQGTTTLVSHVPGSVSTTADDRSYDPVVSADGAYVAFVSSARNLTPGLEDISPAGRNVFLYERATGRITLVSRRAGSAEAANHVSEGPFLSADGSYVGFTSAATDLISGLLRDTLSSNVFLYERASGAMTLVSRRGSSALETGNGSSTLHGLSADGRYLAFVSLATDHVPGQNDSNRQADVFLFDRLAGASTLVSHPGGSALTTGNGVSDAASLSADGRYLAFQSRATDLVSGVSDGNQQPDVFLYDRLLGTVSLVSRSQGSPNAVDPEGAEEPLISQDGGTITYFGSNLSNRQRSLFVFDRLTGSTTLVSPPIHGPITPPSLSGDAVSLSGNGRFVAFTRLSMPEDGSESLDIFLLDRTTGVTVLVSQVEGPSGQVGNAPSFEPVLSADGSWIAFLSMASDLVAGKRDLPWTPDVFLYERATGVNRIVSLHPPGMASLTPPGRSGAPSISGDGRYVAFVSDAAGLFPGHVDPNGASDVFLYDRISKRTTLVSRSSASAVTSANAGSEAPMISRDGNSVLFASRATDLVAGQQDSAGSYDVFLYDRRTGTTTLVSRSRDSRVQAANGGSIPGGVSADGNVVAFTSLATDLVPVRDLNDIYDVFWFDRQTGTVTLVSRASRPRTGRTGNSSSFFSSMSPDGAFIAFHSAASDLVPKGADTNQEGDAFLFQRSSGKVTLLSRTGGTSGPASAGEHPIVSTDGRYAAFLSPGGTRNIVLLDRVSGKVFQVGTTHAPPGVAPGLSDDGRYVLLSSERADVIPGQSDTNGQPDLFLFDRVSGKKTLVSHVPGSPLRTGERGAFGGRLSADGRYVTFFSLSPDLSPELSRIFANVFLYDRTTGDVTLVSRSALFPSRAGNGISLEPTVSASGGFVAFTSFASDLVTGDFNGASPDVFLYVPGEE
jgi:Tol biopolymer transport system component